MDAFFVEVERLRQPKLIGVPVAVGGSGPRGVVASASYEARAFGVSSAMPMGRALRKCRALIVVPPDHSEYRRLSLLVFEILRRFVPIIETVSIDEAFLDVGGMRRHFREPKEVANAIRAAIRLELGLPASAGISVNKLLSKLASQEAKPNGVRLVSADEIEEFLNPLSVRRLWGVGEATYAQLERLGVRTIGDLTSIPIHTLEHRVGATLGRHLFDLAKGIDGRPVKAEGEAKSVSVENTYDKDLVDHDKMERELLRLADSVAERLRHSGMAGRTVTLKIRFSDFTTISRSQTLDWPTNVGRDIFRTVLRLFARSDIGARNVRLIGVGLTQLERDGAPLQLATDRPASLDDLADAVSEVRRRFGSDSVGPASLTEPIRDDDE